MRVLDSFAKPEPTRTWPILYLVFVFAFVFVFFKTGTIFNSVYPVSSTKIFPSLTVCWWTKLYPIRQFLKLGCFLVRNSVNTKLEICFIVVFYFSGRVEEADNVMANWRDILYEAGISHPPSCCSQMLKALNLAHTKLA